jgi:hypothetical protein
MGELPVAFGDVLAETGHLGCGFVVLRGGQRIDRGGKTHRVKRIAEPGIPLPVMIISLPVMA